jgi:hypothetical protein
LNLEFPSDEDSFITVVEFLYKLLNTALLEAASRMHHFHYSTTHTLLRLPSHNLERDCGFNIRGWYKHFLLITLHFKALVPVRIGGNAFTE